MNQNSVPASVTSILSTIHKVDGFDPTPLAVEYMDLTTQEKRPSDGTGRCWRLWHT